VRTLQIATNREPGNEYQRDCVRGANAPKNQCVLTGEFPVGSRS
jgi:hypothetical protein